MVSNYQGLIVRIRSSKNSETLHSKYNTSPDSKKCTPILLKSKALLWIVILVFTKDFWKILGKLYFLIITLWSVLITKYCPNQKFLFFWLCISLEHNLPRKKWISKYQTRELETILFIWSKIPHFWLYAALFLKLQNSTCKIQWILKKREAFLDIEVNTCFLSSY